MFNSRSMSAMSFDSTIDIRQSIYQEWRAERIKSARKEKIEKLKQEKEAEEKERKV